MQMTLTISWWPPTCCVRPRNQPIGIGLTVTSIFSGRRILFGSKAISVHYLFVMTYDTFSRTIMDGVRSSVLVIQKLFILIVDLQWITPRYCFNETSCRPRLLIGEKKKCSKSLHLKAILEKQDVRDPIHNLVKSWYRSFHAFALIKKNTFFMISNCGNTPHNS